MEWEKNGYTISDDVSLVDVDFVYSQLSKTYWASDRPKDVVAKSVESSVNFGLYMDGNQIGFARVVTDKSTFAWICDIVISSDYRGRGFGKWLVECVISHPDIQCRQILQTKDAHELYEPYGFARGELMSRSFKNWSE